MSASSTDTDPARALFVEGLADLRKREYASAAGKLHRSLQITPDRVSTLTNLSAALIKLDRFDEARVLCLKAISLDGNSAASWLNLGLIDSQQSNPVEAIQRFDAALKIQPSYAEAWSNKGAALTDLHRYDEALACLQESVRIDSNCIEGWYNQGVALDRLDRTVEAIRCYDMALGIRPDYVDAWNNRGAALERLGRYDEAIASYERALGINPEYDFLHGAYVHAKMRLCDWSDHQGHVSRLIDKLRAGQKATPPFALLSLTGSAALALEAARIWVQYKRPATSNPPPARRGRAPGKIRLGYFSADFYRHATAHLTAELFELHDRNRFELFAFSFGPDARDEMRQRLALSFDRFIDVHNHRDEEVAALSRELETDIAIDLKGFTLDARPGIFAHRAAPIQVNYLGYPGTMGARFIDYIIADRTVIPAEHHHFYSEKIVYLPGSYQVNDTKRAIAGRIFSREELSLPRESFVFCCFNNNFKITPGSFDSWMRILRQVDGSVLWLLQDHPASAANLRREAGSRGIDPSRLVFAQRMPSSEHLARHCVADLFLDTLPYNAHTTASDALWAGLPVLTCIGETFAGRVAASLLGAVRLPELITTEPEQYEALAIELATNPERLAGIRRRLAANRPVAPLFNSAAFTRHLEDAYAQMHQRYLSGLPPENIVVG